MTRWPDHIRQFEEILHALELRGIDTTMFLYAVTDLARHGEMEELFELNARQVNAPRALADLRKAG
ncbi:hypothetical protein E5163_09805 [Marinicauda algicola]|uniref:Uncharacterized protein n=1 Tax=Marinicauda algicola TaxID=2029849 RepID=A0A4S2GY70_9PROT|nr:hypothetical protein [Marinicauda algicola]TGY88127.1 hypothetical protein E5163_09805 [Marinicauda algicola]